MRYQALMIDDWTRVEKTWNDCPPQRERLLAEVQREMEIVPPATHPSMSITFMALYVFNLSLAYKLTGKEAYRDHAYAWLDTLASYPGWGSDLRNIDVDLSASWVLWGMSCACDWLYDELDETRKTTYNQTISRHLAIFLSHIASHQGSGWPTEYWQNHNWINMTGIAAAGYYLQHHGLSDQGAIGLVRANFEKVFSVLAGDGSNYEGCCYWRYGGMWLFVYAWMERGEGGKDYFLQSGYLQNTFFYRLYQSSPDLARNLNFGDTHDLYSSHPACVYYLVARMYHNGYAQRLGNLTTTVFLKDEIAKSKVHPGIQPEAGLEFIWFDSSVTESDFQNLPLTREFPDLGLVSIRSNWKKDAMVFSAKCGCPGGESQWKLGWKINREHGWKCMSLGHQHPDNLAYQLVLGSHYIIADDGYNRTIDPSVHCVPLVDGKYADVMHVSDVWRASAEARVKANPEYKPDESMCGSMSPLREHDGIYSCEGRTEETYPLDLRMKRASRTFLILPGKWLCMVTILDSEEDHIYTLVTNTYEHPTLVGENLWKYPASGISYRVLCDHPYRIQTEIQTISAMMTPQEPDKVTHVEEHSLQLSTTARHNRTVFVELFTVAGISVDCCLGKEELCLDGRSYKIPSHRDGEVR